MLAHSLSSAAHLSRVCTQTATALQFLHSHISITCRCHPPTQQHKPHSSKGSAGSAADSQNPANSFGRTGHSSGKASKTSQAGRRSSVSSGGRSGSSSSGSSGRSSSNSSTSSTNSSSKASNKPPRNSNKAVDRRAPFQDVRLKGFWELQQLVAAHGASACVADLTAVMSRLKGAQWQQQADKAALLEQLWQHLRPQLKQAAPRHCAEAMLTAAKLGHAPEGLFDACMDAFAAKVHAADARILSNAIYAAATAPQGSISHDSLQQLHQVLLPAFQQQAPTLTSGQSLANVAYGLALLGHDAAAQQLQQLLDAAPPVVWATGSAQNVSMTFWAAGVLRAPLPKQHQSAMLQHLLHPGSNAAAQELATAVYGLTLLQQQLPQQQHEQLAALLLDRPPDAQALSGFLWSTAKLQQQLPQQVVDAFLAKLLQAGPDQLAPQSVSLSLWSVATMERSVGHSQLLQLLRHLAAAKTAVQPQALSMSLWAAAKLKAEVPRWLLDQLYQRFAAVLDSTEPQAVSNALWAAASMQPQPYLPTALLGEQQLITAAAPNQLHMQDRQQQRQRRQQQQRALAVLVSKVPHMKLLELANVALALAVLNVKQMEILRPVYYAAVLHAEARDGGRRSSGNGSLSSSGISSLGSTDTPDGGSDVVGAIAANSSSNDISSSSTDTSNSSSSSAGHSDLQGLSNLCWAGAVLGLSELQPQLRALAQACAAAWDPAAGTTPPTAEHAVQLHQLHMWLLQLDSSSCGLEGLMTPQQLAVCRSAMQSVVGAALPSHWQQQVYEAALQLQPELLEGVELETVTPDGLLSIDIKAEAASPKAAMLAAAVAPNDVSLGQQQQEHQQQQQPQLLQQPAHPIAIAIEVDGPHHYRRPDRAVVGPTCFRNRLLAHQGYLVVSIPYFEWPTQQQPQQVDYLTAAVQHAIQQHCARVANL